MSEQLHPIEREAARFLLGVADALSSVKNTATYGNFYVHEAVIAFDGELTGYRVVPDDTGDGYDLAVVLPSPDVAEEGF